MRVMLFLVINFFLLFACTQKANTDKAQNSDQNAVVAFSGPAQLDILGLVPGVSELSQVRQASINPSYNSDPAYKSDPAIQLEIGGHKVICISHFLNNKLAQLGCLTGEKADIKYTEAPNIIVHNDLVAGFTKKFGKPYFDERGLQRTALGAEYESHIVSWLDKRGNKLSLISILDSIDVGLIQLDSMEYLKEQAQEAALKETQKKF